MAASQFHNNFVNSGCLYQNTEGFNFTCCHLFLSKYLIPILDWSLSVKPVSVLWRRLVDHSDVVWPVVQMLLVGTGHSPLPLLMLQWRAQRILPVRCSPALQQMTVLAKSSCNLLDLETVRGSSAHQLFQGCCKINAAINSQLEQVKSLNLAYCITRAILKVWV